ncbi:uncharacterized protein TNCV_3468481 [Trichonephila clavipes]|nr:uncharacterized protein TNCV_3468481 [Trichonephila clavipes]
MVHMSIVGSSVPLECFFSIAGNIAIHCVTVVPIPARISATDAVQCTTAVRPKWWSSHSVVTSSGPEPSLLEAVPSLDYCFQKSCTVDTFRPRLSAISQKENPPSRSPIMRSRSNSILWFGVPLDLCVCLILATAYYTHYLYNDQLVLCLLGLGASCPLFQSLSVAPLQQDNVWLFT